ncbi:MAG TPA: MerR family transcriptional regulator [Burkholderiales bacterium]|jgi:MerR family mercuric resistance operon transcriptional regulator|nr:MerR family transcriptional regulator [Burkholderiales bacterium]
MNYTIGRLAETAGVHVETVRYYQRRGLVTMPARTNGGFRRYNTTDVERLRFIKRAQSTGFTLAEIEALLTLRASQSCTDTRALATRKLAIVEERLRDLRRLRLELKQWIDLCDHNPKHAPCPSIRKIAA